MSAGQKRDQSGKVDSLYFKSPCLCSHWLTLCRGWTRIEGKVCYFRSVFRPKGRHEDGLTLGTLMSLQSLFVLDSFGFSSRKRESIIGWPRFFKSTAIWPAGTTLFEFLIFRCTHTPHLALIHMKLTYTICCYVFCVWHSAWLTFTRSTECQRSLAGMVSMVSDWVHGRAEPVRQEDCWKLTRNMFSSDLVTSPQKIQPKMELLCPIRLLL